MGTWGSTLTQQTSVQNSGPGAPAGPVLQTGPPRALGPFTNAVPRNVILMAPEG